MIYLFDMKFTDGICHLGTKETAGLLNFIGFICTSVVRFVEDINDL